MISGNARYLSVTLNRCSASQELHFLPLWTEVAKQTNGDMFLWGKKHHFSASCKLSEQQGVFLVLLQGGGIFSGQQ